MIEKGDIRINETGWKEVDKASGVENRLEHIGEPDVYEQITEAMNASHPRGLSWCDGRYGDIVDQDTGEVVAYFSAMPDDGMIWVELFTIDDRDGQYRYHEQCAKEHLNLELGFSESWTTRELTEMFDVKQFMAPVVGAVRKSDDQKITLMFGEIPPFGARMYYNARET